jgi:drug/metabolite transporter (DMT)-like permease
VSPQCIAESTGAARRRVKASWESIMNSQRIFGLVLLVVGGVLFAIGMNSSHSVADQVSNTFTGRFTQATTWYIVGGIAAAILGLLMLVMSPRGRSA